LLGAAVIVLVGGVDEVDAGLTRQRDDALAGGGIGLPAEHHRAEAERRDLEPAAAEAAIVHAAPPVLPLFLTVCPECISVVPAKAGTQGCRTSACPGFLLSQERRRMIPFRHVQIDLSSWPWSGQIPCPCPHRRPAL